MKVSILIATCGRWQMFDDMLSSLQGTKPSEVKMEVIAVIDEDVETYKVAAEYQVNIVDFSLKKRGALWSWNRALQLSSGDIIVPAGDDQRFYPNWLDYALESHREKLGGYGVVGMNDLAYNGNTQLATMFLFDRKYCKEHMGGVLAPPVYKYYCVDSEINAKAKSLNRFYWDERAIVEHLHSAHGKRPVDNHDLDRQKGNYMELDNKIFEERKAQGFPVTWSAII